jgi:hypothetical protein
MHAEDARLLTGWRRPYSGQDWTRKRTSLATSTADKYADQLRRIMIWVAEQRTAPAPNADLGPASSATLPPLFSSSEPLQRFLAGRAHLSDGTNRSIVQAVTSLLTFRLVAPRLGPEWAFVDAASEAAANATNSDYGNGFNSLSRAYTRTLRLANDREVLAGKGRFFPWPEMLDATTKLVVEWRGEEAILARTLARRPPSTAKAITRASRRTGTSAQRALLGTLSPNHTGRGKEWRCLELPVSRPPGATERRNVVLVAADGSLTLSLSIYKTVSCPVASLLASLPAALTHPTGRAMCMAERASSWTIPRIRLPS